MHLVNLLLLLLLFFVKVVDVFDFVCFVFFLSFFLLKNHFKINNIAIEAQRKQQKARLMAQLRQSSTKGVDQQKESVRL